jgi:hypothetical protein
MMNDVNLLVIKNEPQSSSTETDDSVPQFDEPCLLLICSFNSCSIHNQEYNFLLERFRTSTAFSTRSFQAEE